ncbi:MAG: TonB-dependent receptor [Pseudomonadota bacterium]
MQLLRTSTAAAAICAGLSTSAAAQDGAPVDLGTLTLFGDRTTTGPGQTSTSTAVITNQDLENDSSLIDLRDTFSRAANVNDTDWLDSGFVIRGINSEGFTPGGNPLAPLYIDGIEQTQNGVRRGARGTFDLEQVEIYRGPQSTLTGRAGLAGAIYVKTADPVFRNEGAAELTFGGESRQGAALMLNRVLSENVALRFVLEYQERENDIAYPTFEGLTGFDDFTHDTFYQARLKLLVEPSGDARQRLLLSFSHSFDSPMYRDLDGPGFGGSSFDDRRGDFWGIIGSLNFQEARDTRNNNIGIAYSFDVSEALKFTSEIGFSFSDTNRDSVNAGTPGETQVALGTIDQHLITQEFRLNFESQGLRAVGGIYFADGASDTDRSERRSDTDFREVLSSNDFTNLALFGEIDYEFAPQWSVVAGGRIDYFDSDATSLTQRNGAVTGDTASGYSDTVFLPKLGLRYDIDGGSSVALTYQQGYRPGGAGVNRSTGVGFDFDAEFADTLELAYEGRFLQDRLSLRANAFYQDWQDQQVELVTIPGDFSSSEIFNAGSSTAKGAELEVSFAATDSLDLYASVGLLDTEFDSFSIPRGGDFTGLSFPEAPETSISIGFAWQGKTGWFANGTVSYQSSTLSRLEAFVATPVELGARTIVDASVGYDFNNGVRVTLYGRNLLDEEYFTYENGPGVLATLGEGRALGFNVGYTF